MSDPSQPLSHLPRRPRWGDTLTVTLDALSPVGLARGNVELTIGPQAEARRYTVHARDGVPGDRIQLMVEKARRNRVTGRVDVLLTPSTDRVEAPCPHFGPREVPGKGCGGCRIQQMAYPAQLAAKRAMVCDLLAAAGQDPERVAPTIGMDHPWAYRNKMELSFGDDSARRFALGMHPAGYRYEVLRMSTCLLMSDDAAHLMVEVRTWAEAHGIPAHHGRTGEGFLRTLTIRDGQRTGERLVELTTHGAATTTMDGVEVEAHVVAEGMTEHLLTWAATRDIALTSIYWTRHHAATGVRTRLESRLMHGAPMLREALHIPGQPPLNFEIHPRAFFQPNTLQAEVLYHEIAKAAGLVGTDAPVEAQRVLDLYCGTGTIALALAHHAGEVIGIELQPDAVENATRNAARHGIENARFLAGDVGTVLATEGLSDVDLVIVDPPRAGLTSQAIEQVLMTGTKRLVYVSCNPAALARNLEPLAEGGLHLVRVQPVDMFPHTGHIENVALLERTEPREGPRRS